MVESGSELSTIRDIQDICLELTDGGRIDVKVVETSGKFKTYVIFNLINHLDYDGFLFGDISEYVFRIKDFLGDSYKSSSVLFVDSFSERVNIDLDDKSDLRKLNNNEIKNFVIHLK